VADHQPAGGVGESVIGLTSANARTALGIVEVGTNAEEANVSGNTHTNPADYTT
jgi:hypothetical protein